MFNVLKLPFLEKLMHRDSPAPLLTVPEIMELASRLRLDHQQDDNMKTRHLYAGAEQSSHRGSGMDFVENRQYMPGDNPGHINWRLSARLGQLHTRIYQEEKQSQTLVIVDRRPSMWFGTQKQLKVTQALNCAILTMFAATRRHHAFAALAIDKTLHLGEFHLGENHALQQAKQLARVDNRVDRETSCVSLKETISCAMAAYPAGNKIIVLSDFFDMDQHTTTPLTALCQQNKVTAVYISDPAEFELPAAGSIDTFSSGDSEPVAIDTSDPLLRKEFTQSGEERKRSVLRYLAGSGASCLQLGTNQDAWETLGALLHE